MSNKYKLNSSISSKIYDNNFTYNPNQHNFLYNNPEELNILQKGGTKSKKKSNKKSKKKGGFLFFSNSGLKKYIQETIKSEKKLIKTHNFLVDSVSNWTKAYDNHLQNLIKLDEFLGSSQTLQNIFKDIIMDKYMKKTDEVVDPTLSLFIQNYYIDEDSTPVEFKKEHVIRQIFYVLDTDFRPSDKLLIKDIDINIINDDKIEVNLRTVDNKTHTFNILHKNLNLHLPSVKEALQDILSLAKSETGTSIKGLNKNNNGKKNILNSTNLSTETIPEKIIESNTDPLAALMQSLGLSTNKPSNTGAKKNQPPEIYAKSKKNKVVLPRELIEKEPPVLIRKQPEIPIIKLNQIPHPESINANKIISSQLPNTLSGEIVQPKTITDNLSNQIQKLGETKFGNNITSLQLQPISLNSINSKNNTLQQEQLSFSGLVKNKLSKNNNNRTSGIIIDKVRCIGIREPNECNKHSHCFYDEQKHKCRLKF